MMLAVEIGFGDVKVIGEGVRIKFPTVLAYAGSGVLTGWNDGDKSCLFCGKKYLVGKDALGRTEMFSSRDPEFLLEFAPLFLYKAFQEAGIVPGKVALGLALGYYSAKEKLKGRVLSFEVNGERIELLDCTVFPQAVGIWYDWASSNPGRVYGNYMILDIGFNTVDVVFVKSGKALKEGSWMLEGEGMIKVVNGLADLIQQKVGVGILPHTGKNLLEKRSLTVWGKEKSLERAISKLSLSYTDRLFSNIQARSRERLRSLDGSLNGIILGGGGAYYVREFVPKGLRNIVEVAPEPEFSNARGFYKAIKEQGGKHENKTEQSIGGDSGETQTEYEGGVRT